MLAKFFRDGNKKALKKGSGTLTRDGTIPPAKEAHCTNIFGRNADICP